MLNAGSSTLKAAVVEPPSRQALFETTTEWSVGAGGAPNRSVAVTRVLEQLAADGITPQSITGVGHRVVHGGTRFVEPSIIDDEVVAVVQGLADLAPLHNLVAAETIEAARLSLPAVPHVAVFDTAFHATLPPAAYRYPVPEPWFRDWGVRRFGFHGISVAWSVQRAAELLGRPPGQLRLVVAHLGAGCSVTAVDGGRSVDTSMGLTPLEGLMMTTRSGSIDPGVPLRLLREGRRSPADLEDDLENRSGLLGVSGRSGDVRELLDAEGAGDERAALALEMFVRRAAAGIAGAGSCLPALDGVVFTGGIGEHAAGIRARIVDRLATLGVRPIASLATAADAGSGDTTDAILSEAGDGPAVLRIRAREDLVIADAVRRLIAEGELRSRNA